LEFDPDTVQKKRAKGITSDRSDLNMIEKRMAYGVKWTSGDAPGTFNLTLVALKSKEVVLQLVDGSSPKAITSINGRKSYMTRVWVELKQRMIGVPKVVYIIVKGIDVETGEEIEEKIMG
jgi:hypothetical protein